MKYKDKNDLLKFRVQCNNIAEFQKKFPGAYKAAVRLNCLYELFPEHRVELAYEDCKAVARKYYTKKEFRENDAPSYNKARLSGWLKDYTWLENGKKPNGWWKNNIDHCIEVAQKVKDRKELKHHYHSAYIALKDAGIIDKLFPLQVKPNGYWLDHNNCYNAARECSSTSEFKIKYDRGYQVSRLNGWDKDYVWFEDKPCFYTDDVDSVYLYVWPKLKTIYVGRTVNPTDRNKQHRDNENDIVYKTIKKLGAPKYYIIKTNIDVKTGLFYEDYYKIIYKENGWNVLNKAKTGIRSGSVGALGMHRRTKQRCLEAAQQCSTVGEFIERYNTLYIKSLRKGWLKEYTWLQYNRMQAGYWDVYENCRQESAKYRNKKDFQIGCASAYNASKRHRKGGRRWIDIFFPDSRQKETIIIKPVVIRL